MSGLTRFLIAMVASSVIGGVGAAGASASDGTVTGSLGLTGSLGPIACTFSANYDGTTGGGAGPPSPVVIDGSSASFSAPCAVRSISDIDVNFAHPDGYQAFFSVFELEVDVASLSGTCELVTDNVLESDLPGPPSPLGPYSGAESAHPTGIGSAGFLCLAVGAQTIGLDDVTFAPSP